MMYDPMELIGRYALTGVILWGAAFILLLIRMFWVGSKSDAGLFGFLQKWNELKDEVAPKVSKYQNVFEFVVWPYGIPKAIAGFIRLETRTLREIQEQ